MTHSELVNTCLAVHGPILLAVVGAYYRFGEHSDFFSNLFKEIEVTIQNIRYEITQDLDQKLRIVIQNAGTIPTPILNSGGNHYIEKPVNPVGSEAYRECIDEFIDSRLTSIIDYKVILRAKNIWFKWIKWRSWCVLCLLGWQILAVGAIAILEKIFGLVFTDWILKGTIIPTGFLVICFVFQSILIMRYRNYLSRVKEKYEIH